MAKLRAVECREFIKAVVEKAEKMRVPVAIAVANAGIGAPGFVAQLKKEDFERVVAVNLTGVFLCAKHAFRAMQKTGGGCILTMASVAGLQGSLGLGGYGPSKAGTVQLTQTLALGFKPGSFVLEKVPRT